MCYHDGRNQEKYQKTERIPVQDTFESLYRPLLKDVFTEQARQQLAQGAEACGAARMYAELGKPDFTLAFLLLGEQADEEKREEIARPYERLAALSEEKAAAY